jgi:hypothetical protein
MRYMKVPIVILTSILGLQVFSCKIPTAPGDIAHAGGRNYVWTFDTLTFRLNGYMRAVWASSPTDVWAGGYEDLFHYDGVKWLSWPRIPCDVNTLRGFGPKDIWVGGNNGRIMHFDGVQWSVSIDYSGQDGNKAAVWIQYIYGTSSNDVYAVGNEWIQFDASRQRGFILHNDGRGWKEVYRTSFNFQLLSVRAENGLAYVFGIKPRNLVPPDTDVIYQFRDGILSRIYAGTEDQSLISIDDIGGMVQFLLPQGVCRYEDKSQYFATGHSLLMGDFVKEFSINDPNFNWGVAGRNIEDVFVTMHDGIAHWNGIDLKYLVRFPDSFIIIPSHSVFEKDVFFCVFDAGYGVNMVVHGKVLE